MKKIFTVLLALLATGILASCGGKQKDVLRIYAWNTEFQDRFNEFYKVPEGIEVEFVINANQGNVYQTKLDEALKKQAKAKPKDRIDIFLVEADYALKYVDTDYTLDVINEVGLTEADVKDQYQYTKDVVTADGKLKGVSWQACPGAFIYRRSYAQEVLGTDDPDQVQEKINTWEKFDAVAEQMKAKGKYMLSGYDDAYRVFSNNVSNPWVDKNNKITIDPNITKWIDQTKTYTEKGFNNKASLWSPESQKGMAKDGNVFGYFGPSWFMDFCFLQYTLEDAEGERKPGNGSYGDWAMAKGPQSFFWGGTWICAAAGTDNLDIVKDVLKTMTCEKETLVKITEKFGDFTNNVPAMTEIANSDFKYDFLGNQNHIAVLLEAAQAIEMKNIGPYDQGITEELMSAMKDYYEGTVTKDEAYENFYTGVIEKYPNLKK